MIAQFLFSVLVIGLTFLVLVAPHEGGHFAMAKLCRMRVIEFSIGMGPKLVSTVAGRTMYAFRLLPIGGFVRLGGMEPGDYSDPNGFHAKPAYQRLLVLVAGPFVNFVVAAMIVTGILLSQVGGDPGLIQGVEPNTPAAAAGLQRGDSIRDVNGAPLQSSSQLRDIEQRNPGQPLELTVRHANGTSAVYRITPRLDTARHAHLIGIDSNQTVTVREAVVNGAMFPVTTIGQIASGMYQLVSGQVPGGAFGPQGFTGPVGIAAISSQTAQAGPVYWLTMVALLSVALGFFNLLPVPVLDGGRIMVVLLEKLRGHPFDREREMLVQRYSLAALLTLVLVISYFDLQRIVTHQFPGIH